MSLINTQSLDADWEFFDAKTPVTYIPYDNATDANIDADKVEDIEALTQETTKEDFEYGQSIGVHQELRTWNLRASMMGNTIVTKHGKIVDEDGVEWVVIKCRLRSLKTRWNCLTYNLNG